MLPVATPVQIENPKRKSRIGEGCLYAVVSHSGYFIKKTNLEDDYGTDFEIRELIEYNGRRKDINTFFSIQLKCTSNWEIVDDHIVYDLEVKTYNDIVLQNTHGSTKLILVLMCLEKDESNWCTIDHESIKFQNSLFWYYTDATETSDNESTIRIKIPVQQIFHEEAIEQLINTFQISITD